MEVWVQPEFHQAKVLEATGYQTHARYQVGNRM